ncbi:Thioredoxin reductase [Labilithrix luteola]|uniref:Thioredoxin reductase n=1 Tax=Labilithrix luteola TaxID=1391654 RepID=A0A0K1Q885_9BACT|nr:NAD(P)-binding domain-containing protein [Labilithrix luteola]AKV01867.1 Thioredoxin reductase [Labilithrix luteola]
MSERARVKNVRRAIASSDVTRAGVLGLVALGAAAAAVCTVATSGLPAGHDRAVAPPHTNAGVTCVKCHEPGQAPSFAASSGCTACHASSSHLSARPAHRSLAARGELTCATCHPAHDAFQGVTFGPDGGALRWGAGAVPVQAKTNGVFSKPTTVPLVSLAACAKCHDPRDARDPIAACVSRDVRRDPESSLATRPSLCFDEHRPASRAEARAVAWEATRAVAVTTPWVSRASNANGPWLPVAGAFGGAAAFGALVALRDRRRRDKALPPAPKLETPAARRKLPVIDASRCLGCYACVDACPFDVLTIEKYVAVVARPDECCGVVLCERVCPNGSLTIDEGDATKDIPHVDEHLESPHVPGLYLAGDLTGLPLIKNAIHQGVRVVDRIASTMPKKRTEPIDVLVVGAGPAGLSAALRAREKGLSCVVLEQASVAASIKSFPRDKIVHDPPLDLPVEGELWLREATKEELVAQWTRIVRTRAIDVREGRRVTRIEPRGAGFEVGAELEGQETIFRAARVVLAIGRRGTPKTLPLAVDPGAESKISHALADARSFAGKRVLVVGLGDSAMEAAVALARQPGTSVTVSYRGRDFTRGKARNVGEMKQLLAKGALKLLFGTVPVAVTTRSVKLAGTDGRPAHTLPVDAVLVLVGGHPSWGLLEVAGVRRRGEGGEA